MEYFGLVHEFQLQAETEFQHAGLLVGACLDQIPRHENEWQFDESVLFARVHLTVCGEIEPPALG